MTALASAQVTRGPISRALNVVATDLLFAADNTNDIGTSSASRPRSIFAGTSIFAGSGGRLGFLSVGRIVPSADAIWSLSNNAETYGIRLQYAAVPTVGTCGTSPAITAGSTDTAGSVNVGTGGTATSCGITFAGTWASAPFCTASVNTATAGNTRAMGVTTTTTTATFTAATAFVASDKVLWICIGPK